MGLTVLLRMNDRGVALGEATYENLDTSDPLNRQILDSLLSGMKQLATPLRWGSGRSGR